MSTKQAVFLKAKLRKPYNIFTTMLRPKRGYEKQKQINYQTYQELTC